MRALLPHPIDGVDPVAAYALPAGAGAVRPFVRCNMISTLDGAITLDGRSGMLGGSADRQVFQALRSLADVILVGAGTARAEKYQPVGEAEVWRALRDGRAPTPPIAVVTRSLDMDVDGPLLARAPGHARTIVLTSQAAPAARRAAAARHADVVVTGGDVVSPAAAVGALAARGHQRVLLEGGPNLLSQITAAGLLDELCLTVSPMLVGGGAGRILAAAGGGAVTGLRLAHVLEDAGYLLCRYLRGTG